MSQQDSLIWMWKEARRALDRAERMHRCFFELGRNARQPSWEPPADIFATDDGFFIEVAMPGVDPQRIETAVEGDIVLVSGERALRHPPKPLTIQRLEIPYGRFERRIPLPPGRYELARRDVVNGCIVMWLRRMSREAGR